jgi:phosphatidylinositol alpha-1,6-mannosyltransferase
MHTLVLTEQFLPTAGGSITWLVNTYSRYGPGKVIFVASQNAGGEAADRTLPFPVERTSMTMTDWDPTIPASFLCYLKSVLCVLQICRKYKIRQIHCAKVLPEGFIAFIVSLYTHTPFLIYAHGEEIQSGLTSRKFRWLLPKIYSRAFAIIANSSNTSRLLQEIGIASRKIHIIHPGVNTQKFICEINSSGVIRNRYNLYNKHILLTVGRLQRRKGHDMVIKALPRIKQRFPDVHYVVVGTGEELFSLQNLASEEGVTDSVLFVGYVPDDEIPSYYAACDIFLMPNRQIGADIEGFGMVFLEASAAGKPVIGGKSGGTDDAILDGVTGLRINGDNVDQITNAVLALLSDPQKASALGANGRRWVQETFTWESVVGRTQALSRAI